MSTLDDPALLRLDVSDMFARIAELGTELTRAWDTTAELELPAGARGAANVVLTGMGGSASAADYFAALCLGASEIPVSVVRGYALPNFVSERSLVVVSSYSGNTEEALSAYDDAWKRDAALSVITHGGQLAERAKNDGVPVHRITYESLPRAAIAHGLAPLLRIGSLLGLCAVSDEDVRTAGELHRAFVEAELRPATPESANGAKRLARALKGRVPIILGAEHLSAVAVRFKNQIAENGKALAAAESLPELAHNLVVGLETGKVSGELVTLVLLESGIYDGRIRRRFEATARLFQSSGVPVQRVSVGGETRLQQLLLGTAWGDYTSCYLALLNGVDPTPIPQIERLKAILAE
jgi:glucose/mannose-6-phosphate isomerase